MSKVHEAFLSHLEGRVELTDKIVKSVKGLAEKYEECAKKLKGRAETKRRWAAALSFIPEIGPLASKLLLDSDRDIVQALEKSDQGKVAKSAALAISKVLVPAFQEFVKDYKFFEGLNDIMESELSKVKTDNFPKDLEAFRIRMKDLVLAPIDECENFIATLPSIKCDIASVAEKELSNVAKKKWVKIERDIIFEHCTDDTARLKILRLIKSDGEEFKL